MTTKFFELAFTADVLAAQEAAYGRSQVRPKTGTDDELGGAESGFLGERDSFYMATVNTDGWPYLQHRGGSKGLVRVLDSRHFAFADLGGNRQLLSVGNLQGDGRAAFFFMDYPGRRRLKILGYADVRPADDPQMLRLWGENSPQGIERFVLVQVVAYDWNCPKYIRPRYDLEAIEAHQAELKTKVADLEAEVARLRARSFDSP